MANSYFFIGQSTFPVAGSQQTYQSDLFYADDFLVRNPDYAFWANGSSKAGLNTTSTGFADVASSVYLNHPGVLYCSVTGAANGQAIAANGYSGNANEYNVAVPNDPSTRTYTYVFLQPPLGSATNRYTFSVGAINPTTGGPQYGWCLQYADNQNSGNYRFIEFYGGAAQQTVNTSIAAVAGTWYRLTITIVNNTVSATLNVLGQAPTSIASFTSPTLNASTTMLGSTVGMTMIMSAWASGTYTALLDYHSVSVSGLSRSW